MFTFSAALRFGKLSSPCILTLRLKRSLQTISTQKTLFVVSMASFPCFVCLSSLCLNYNDITHTTKVFCVYTEIGQGICGNLHKLVCVWKSTKFFRCLLFFFVLSLFSKKGLFECRDFFFAINKCPAKPQISHLEISFQLAGLCTLPNYVNSYLMCSGPSHAIRGVSCELSTESQNTF